MFLDIMIFILLPLLILILIIERINNHRLGKIPLENTMEILLPEKTYQIIYKVGLFKTLRYTITPQKDHKTIMYYTVYYNGKANALINVTMANLKVYEANLRDVRSVEKE